MKIIDSTKKQDRIKAMFGANPNLDTILIIADGCGFTVQNKSSAEAHQATLQKGELEEAKRDDYIKVATDKTKDKGLLAGNLKAVKAGVLGVNSIEELEAFREEELAKGDEARKGAVEAIESRIEELTKNIDVDADNVDGADTDASAEE